MVSLVRIILFGNDIEGLKRFYQLNFKLNLLEEIEGEWVVLNAGEIEIAFHKIGYSHQKNELFKVESNAKLVFGIDEEIIIFRERLMKNGVNMKDVQSFGTLDFLYCDGEDIEGNVFQLQQKRP